MIKQTISNKKSQSEVITTILLILISITAVVLVSAYIINMVKSNLVGTECFKTANQFNINLEEGFTYYNSSNESVSVSISRGEGEFNLTGILISVSSGSSSTAYTLKPGQITAGASMYNGSATIIFPQTSETKTYRIISTENVTRVKIVPIIYPNNRLCEEGLDEQAIPSK